jgi:hypothetical protein
MLSIRCQLTYVIAGLGPAIQGARRVAANLDRRAKPGDDSRGLAAAVAVIGAPACA